MSTWSDACRICSAAVCSVPLPRTLGRGLSCVLMMGRLHWDHCTPSPFCHNKFKVNWVPMTQENEKNWRKTKTNSKLSSGIDYSPYHLLWAHQMAFITVIFFWAQKLLWMTQESLPTCKNQGASCQKPLSWNKLWKPINRWPLLEQLSCLTRLAARGMSCLPAGRGGSQAINRSIACCPGWRRKQAHSHYLLLLQTEEAFGETSYW